MLTTRNLLCFAAIVATSTVTTAPLAAQTMQSGSMPMGAPMAPHAPSPIHVTHCNPSLNQQVGYTPGFYPAGPYYWNDVYGRGFVQPMYTNNPTLAIHYVNVTNKVIKTVEFGLVARGSLVAEVRDVGTFSPGADIKHRFGISQNVFPIGTGLPQCLPLRVTFEDGTKWRSSHLPALSRSLYSH